MSAPVRITMFDEAPGTGRREAFTLELAAERVTARDLITQRVRHEVDIHNRRWPTIVAGCTEAAGAPSAAGRGAACQGPIDAEAQVRHAIKAFERRRVLLLVGDRQVEHLDDVLDLRTDSQVCFFKLVALVGG